MPKFGELYIKRLNQNKVFKFISSVRLAVPLMLGLGGIVAWGTVVESMYNSEYASIVVYKSFWFGLLLIALWINIFTSTISRWPFKAHHTGFVITHIGLLLLLAGGWITNSKGIDGQLVVPESGKSSMVVLPKLMVAYQSESDTNPNKIQIRRGISETGPVQLNSEREVPFQVVSYKPFVQVNSVYESRPESESTVRAFGFQIKSAFFDTSVWLNSEENPLINMGPAQFRMKKVENILTPTSSVQKTSANRKLSNQTMPKKKNPSKSNTLLTVLLADSSKSFSLEQLEKGIQVGDIKISLSKKYQRAIVSGNKIIEGDSEQKINPALEIYVEKDEKREREVVYANFDGFSLHPDGVFGLKFRLQVTGESDAIDPVVDSTSKDPTISGHTSNQMGGNVVEFQYDDQHLDQVRIQLYKNNQFVDQKTLKEGELFQTPWMGMQLTVNSIIPQAVAKTIVQSIEPEKGQELPASAILIEWKDENSEKKSQWFSEGEEKFISISGKRTQIYYGRETLELPFDVFLQKFSKIDYPGTETPMSYESDVRINDLPQTYKIAMNEPLKMAGFTIYQSSFSITPQQTLSIFSVNQDPGRWIKYLGSLILSLGIIIFTLMRSQFWKRQDLGKG